MSRYFPNGLLAAILLGAQFSARAEATNDVALKSVVLENEVAYLRVGEGSTTFAEETGAAQNAPATNKIIGTVLDLRFADGESLAAAEQFLAAKKSPLVILVNGETRGAAADWAARLRAAGAGLIIGSTNAAGKIAPDIAVAVSGAAEKKFQADPFAEARATNVHFAAANNLLPFVDHMSEAELVSKRAKDGELDEPDAPRAGPPQPVVRDPALARALDLLKALAVLNRSRG
jgi:hypothetical protein